VNRAHRLARLLRILAAIVAEPGLNPLELAERAGVSDRTLRRDLAQLRDLGYEVEYTSGYEVQEKLNLDGRSKKGRATKSAGDRQELELLQAVAQAVAQVRLGDRGAAPPPAARPRPPSRARTAAAAPLVLIAGGDGDTDFYYATGFGVEAGLYIRFGEGDDLLAVSPLEIDRARDEGRVKSVLGYQDVGYEELGRWVSWPRVAARLLASKGHSAARVGPALRGGHLDELRAAGLAVDVDRDLFVAERRHKSDEEARAIAAAQEAAEAAVTWVVRELARSEIRDGLLWIEGSPLTSERLYAGASLLLGELGFTCPEMIIAGSPECAMPHFRGAGQLRANVPVIIDIFPSSRTTHYHGDLTRTVVVGEVPEQIRRMHAAVLQSLDAGIESIRAGIPARDVHHTVCEVLVDRGYGTTTKGYEGADGGPKMNHSTGHGVGLDVHEAPNVRGPGDDVLQEGDVVTVEPGLYELGLGGVRIEDTGRVTAAGFENFTRISRSLDPRDY